MSARMLSCIVSEDWEPTPEKVAMLPKPIRDYIRSLQRKLDSNGSGTIKADFPPEKATGGEVLVPCTASSNIQSFRYYEGGALDITFQGGGRYQYSDVPPEVYEALRAAISDKLGSVSKVFQDRIRGYFRYEKLE